MEIHEKIRSSNIKTKRPVQIKEKRITAFREVKRTVKTFNRTAGKGYGKVKEAANYIEENDNKEHTTVNEAFVSDLQKAGSYLKKHTQKAAVAATKKSVKQIAGQKKQINEIRTAFANVKSKRQPVKSREQPVKSAQGITRSKTNKGKIYRYKAHQIKRSRVTPTPSKIKRAAHSVKDAFQSIAAVLKAITMAFKSLVMVILAGGWLILLIVLAAGLIAALIASVFSIFFGNASDETALQLSTAMSTINNEFNENIQEIAGNEQYDRSIITINGKAGSDISDTWKQVLAVYAVRASFGEYQGTPIDFSDPEKIELLRSTFFDMVSVSGGIEELSDEVVNNDGETIQTTAKILKVSVSSKTAHEMTGFYQFTQEQSDVLDELLDPKMDDVWKQLLYGSYSGIGNGDIVETAISQLGNVGGQPYWSWYGFSSRVEWCACFVSWCAEQNGFIQAEIMPKFSYCDTGIAWFKEHNQWRPRGYDPLPGDIIFFDWNYDGVSDHVGIVEYSSYGVIHTVEGNSGDSCTRMTYSLDSGVIQGYGTPSYPLTNE